MANHKFKTLNIDDNQDTDSRWQWKLIIKSCKCGALKREYITEDDQWSGTQKTKTKIEGGNPDCMLGASS